MEQADPPARHGVLSRRRFVVTTFLGIVGLLESASTAVDWFVDFSGTHRPESAGDLDALALYGDRSDFTVPSRRPEARLGWDRDVILHCHLFRARLAPSNHPRRCVVLVHGWQSNATDTGFRGLGQTLLQPPGGRSTPGRLSGDDVLLVNLGPADDSTGRVWGLGTFEGHDLIAVYQSILLLGYAPHRVAFVAQSMGAAALLEAFRDDASPSSINIRRAAAYYLIAPYNRFSAVAEQIATPAAPVLGWWAGIQSDIIFGVNPLQQQSLAGRIPGFPGDRVDILYNVHDNTIPASQAQEIRAFLPGARLRALSFNRKRPTANDFHEELSYRVGEAPLVNGVVGQVRHGFEVAQQTL